MTESDIETPPPSNQPENPHQIKKKPMPRWFKISIFMTLLALILVSAGLLFTESLVDTVEKQLDALRKNDIETAYQAYTSKDFQAATSMDQFRQFVRSYPILHTNHSALFPQRSIKDHMTILRGKLMEHDHGSTPIEYRLVKEDGKWKILSMRLLKVQAQNSAEKRELVQLTQSQLKEIEEGNISQAYDRYSSEEFKQATSLEDFKKFIKKYPILIERHLTSFHNPILQDNKGRLSIILRSDQYVAFLKNYYIYENGGWKILSMRILSPSENMEMPEEQKQKPASSMEITALSLGQKADEQGIILEPSTHFVPNLGDLYVNISIQNGQKDALFNLTLKQVESGSSISSQVRLEEEGDTLLTTIFSPPPGGWLPGHYQILVNGSNGILQTVDFEIG